MEYYPFRPLSDTAALHQQALQLFRVALPELRPRTPAFIVLRAVSLRARERVGVYTMRNFGFVFEPHQDGLWYEYQSAGPAVALRSGPQPSNVPLQLTIAFTVGAAFGGAL